MGNLKSFFTRKRKQEESEEEKLERQRITKEQLWNSVDEKDKELFTDFQLQQTTYGEWVLVYKSVCREHVAFVYLDSIREGDTHQCQMNLIIEEDETKEVCLYITDIQVLGDENMNKGYGSILIQEAIKLAKELGLRQIKGRIISNDENHLKRQEAFYAKHGFSIEEDGAFHMVHLEVK